MVENYTKGIEEKFLIWMQNGKIASVELSYRTRMAIFYDAKGQRLLIRRGLSYAKMNEIEKTIKKCKFKKEKIQYYFGGI